MHVFGALMGPPAVDGSVFSSPFCPMWPQTRGSDSIRDGAAPNSFATAEVVAENIGGSNAPAMAQLRRCTSATHRQPRDDIRAQSSRSSPQRTNAPNTKRARTPHTASQGSQLSLRLGGQGEKKRFSRFFALVSDPVQTPSRPNLLQSSPQSRRVRAHLVTSEALSQDDPSSARPGCRRCLSKFLFLFLSLIVVWLQVVTREAILDVALIHAHA
ncbi:hypothetical protein CFIO01_02682 [Colletotrichum fioriniae PJ7]|uniref:Uncharacterized protein n=1 Tax=Colletotrichum fioriniae PJ7 TaxID=1445577 RepID=A0A010RV42_9PEZI|nr:hypothetical protein CFIO01_02682 [Colletotrichum fioriniae PJ7]